MPRASKRYFAPASIASVNEAGFRDGRRAIDVIDGRRRILFFGDSEIFGWGVDTSGRASNLLGRGLPGWEILNLAAPGYGLDQLVLSYEGLGPANPGATIVLLVSTATIRRTLSSRLYRKFSRNSCSTARAGSRAFRSPAMQGG